MASDFVYSKATIEAAVQASKDAVEAIKVEHEESGGGFNPLIKLFNDLGIDGENALRYLIIDCGYPPQMAAAIAVGMYIMAHAQTIVHTTNKELEDQFNG